MTFLRRTGENSCSKQREGRTEENKHGNQRGTEVEKIKKEERLDVSRHENLRDTQSSTPGLM